MSDEVSLEAELKAMIYHHEQLSQTCEGQWITNAEFLRLLYVCSILNETVTQIAKRGVEQNPTSP